jgi:HlyD family secretion protein
MNGAVVAAESFEFGHEFMKMKKILIAAASIIILVLLAGILFPKRPKAADFRTVKVERGAIVATVSATGNLAAVVTVQVGTQVSGSIQKLFVDYNSPVKKGQVIAQIDPALFKAKVEQTQGNHLAAKASLDKARAELDDAKRTLDRYSQLLAGNFISRGEFDVVDTKYQMALSAVAAAEGSVTQALGAYSEAKTNLDYCAIRSPNDGVVISRNVDVGQTVAASFQTPTLFTIAQDLTKMEIETSVDEADISKVKVGQAVTFSVDSYANVDFHGTVTQIRNAPIITQNVVTYTVIVSVDNKDLLLKPGMTANVSIETARKENVLKLPSAVLRFKPKDKPAAGAANTEGEVVYVVGSDGLPAAVPVTVGISDGSSIEIGEGDLWEGDEVIVEQLSAKKKDEAATGKGPQQGPGF